jgi:hypothetical protein
LAVGQHVDADDQSGEEVFDDRGWSVDDGVLERGRNVFEVVASGRGWRPVERSRDLAAV